MEYFGFKSKRSPAAAVPIPSSDDDVSGGIELQDMGGGRRHRQEDQRMSKHKMKQLKKQQRKVWKH